MLQNGIHVPVLALFFLIYYDLPSPFLVQVGKINMFCMEKTRMELKCDRYDVTDTDVLNVFYNTKTICNTETDFPYCL